MSPVLAEAVGGFDVSVFDLIVSCVEKIANVFTIYPLNIFLGVGIVGATIGIFRGLRKSA